ncbi:MAG: T9SS type A sorting domain-containing protein, partial [Bacteroidales bacterium]|nr:T9SS type A sorting domain-containing protein [Bacteroidales bacterium]
GEGGEDPGEGGEGGDTAIDFAFDNGMAVWADPANVYVANAIVSSMLRIYSINGACVLSTQLTDTNATIPFEQHGVFIVQIIDSNGVHGYKIVK